MKVAVHVNSGWSSKTINKVQPINVVTYRTLYTYSGTNIMRSPTEHHVHWSLPNVHGHQQDLICNIVEPDIMELPMRHFFNLFAGSDRRCVNKLLILLFLKNLSITHFFQPNKQNGRLWVSYTGLDVPASHTSPHA